MKSKLFLGVMALVSSLLLAGCQEKKTKETQADKALAAANSIKFSANAEIDNIKKRLELTSNPAQIGFILLLNEMGKPVMYASVQGKVTSGGKRLTNPMELTCGSSCGVLPTPSDEGKFGTSGEYIFFWTTSGQYFQWAGKYLYSDKPFRIDDPTIVILK